MSETRQELPTVEESPLLLRAEEAARLLGYGRSTVFAMLQSGELPAVRYGRTVRVPRRAIERWIAEQVADSEPRDAAA